MSRPEKRRRLSPPEDDARSGKQSSFLKSAAKWDLEQDYENRPRRLDKKKKKAAQGSAGNFFIFRGDGGVPPL